jgi:hypothetical protein
VTALSIVEGLLGLAMILTVLWDAFEVIILPRRVTRRVRLTRVLIIVTWQLYSKWVHNVRGRARRAQLLGYYGPLAALTLFVTWAFGLVIGFGLLQLAFGSQLVATAGSMGAGAVFYMSGTTFFTLGLGDVVPRSGPARVLTVAEGGLGFAFLASIISYLPVLYQTFSRREARISMLDEWAGSPPSAGELLRRLGRDEEQLLGPFLREWELWSSQLLEAMISYPILGYFRSQHDNQSWVAALTMIMDACAMLMANVEAGPVHTASLTFSMARHAVVDLCQIFNAPPFWPEPDRLPPTDFARLCAELRAAGVIVHDDPERRARFQELREMYEPYVNALARRLHLDLPRWIGDGVLDNWQRTAWRTIGTTHTEPQER